MVKWTAMGWRGRAVSGDGLEAGQGCRRCRRSVGWRQAQSYSPPIAQFSARGRQWAKGRRRVYGVVAGDGLEVALPDCRGEQRAGGGWRAGCVVVVVGWRFSRFVPLMSSGLETGDE